MDHLLAGRYRLAERLGEGGAGTVWRARDELLTRDVAVKQVRVPPELGGPERARFVDRAIHEARAAGRLRDAGIVVVHDVLLEHGLPWIIMDLVTGRSLDQVVRQGGPLPPATVARIGVQVLSALEVAHAHGILHQDVKPANVLLDADGRALLADFGIAATMDAAGDVLASAGSPGYMAPERLNGRPAGTASDLWSLAATLYTAVEGVAPFQRALPAAVAAAVLLHEPPPPVRAGRELGGLLSAMLAKDPAGRPGAAAVRQGLLAAQHAPPATSRNGRGRGWKVPAAIAAVVLLAGGALAYGLAVRAEAGAGRFASAPDPCELITAERAATLLGGTAGRARPRPGECQWSYLVRGIVQRSITVRVKAHRPQGGHDGPGVAALLFGDDRSHRGKEENTAFRTTTSTLRDVPGVGEEAFAQDRFERYMNTDEGEGQLWCTVVARTSNLTGEIVYHHRDVQGASAADRAVAVDTAKQVFAALSG